MCRRTAAQVNCSSSPIAMKHRKCRNSTRRSLYREEQCITISQVSETPSDFRPCERLMQTHYGLLPPSLTDVQS